MIVSSCDYVSIRQVVRWVVGLNRRYTGMSSLCYPGFWIVILSIELMALDCTQNVLLKALSLFA